MWFFVLPVRFRSNVNTMVLTARQDHIRHTEGYTCKPAAPGEFDVWLGEQDRDAS